MIYLVSSQVPSNNSKINSNGTLHQMSTSFACEPTLPEIDEEPLYKGKNFACLCFI